MSKPVLVRGISERSWNRLRATALRKGMLVGELLEQIIVSYYSGNQSNIRKVSNNNNIRNKGKMTKQEWRELQDEDETETLMEDMDKIGNFIHKRISRLPKKRAGN